MNKTISLYYASIIKIQPNIAKKGEKVIVKGRLFNTIPAEHSFKRSDGTIVLLTTKKRLFDSPVTSRPKMYVKICQNHGTFFEIKEFMPRKDGHFIIEIDTSKYPLQERPNHPKYAKSRYFFYQIFTEGEDPNNLYHLSGDDGFTIVSPKEYRLWDRFAKRFIRPLDRNKKIL